MKKILGIVVVVALIGIGYQFQSSEEEEEFVPSPIALPYAKPPLAAY